MTTDSRVRRELGATLPTGYGRRLGGTVAVVLAVLGTIGLVLRSRDPIEIMRRDAGRVGVARLHGFAHAPVGGGRAGTMRATEAARRIQAKVASTDNSRAMHELGVALLAAGRTREAVDALTRAAHGAAENAVILSDLAAAQIEDGRIADAAETAARALALDPGLPAAAFNWALALETLGHRDGAAQAWRAALRVSDVEGWAGEAAARLRALEARPARWEDDQKLLAVDTSPGVIRRVVRRYPQRSRYWIQDEVLPRWAADPEADDLAMARRIAAIRVEDGDAFLRDVVEHAAADARRVREPLARFASARRIAQTRDWDAAARAFAQAIAELDRIRSPLALAARSFASSVDFYRNDYTAAERRLDELDVALARLGNPYPGLAAESGWRRALVLARTGNGRELDVLRGAREQAVRGREWEHVLAIEMLLASALDRTGLPDQGDGFRWKALQALSDLGAPDDRVASFHGACALSSLRQRRPRLALAFLDAMRRMPVVKSDPLLAAETEAWRGQAFHEVGLRAEAMRALNQARSAAVRVAAPAMRDRVTSDIDFISGLTGLATNPAAAVGYLTDALATYEKRQWTIRAARAFHIRGIAFERLGQDGRSEIDYRRGIEQMERQRVTFDEPAFRVAYFEGSGDLFHNLIAVLERQGRYEEAFDVVERRSARSLLDRLSQDAVATPLRSREIMAHLPPRVAVIAYAVQQDRVSIWLLRRDRVVHARTTASSDAVRRMAGEHRAAILGRDARRLESAGRWLYAQLVAPVRNELPPEAQLVVVPDAELGAIPFAALKRADGTYLAEHHALSFAPSATILVRGESAAGAVRHIVAASAPGGEEEFERLGWTDAEARAVARMYPEARLLMAGDATPKRFLEEAARADAVHFAGHARDGALVFGSGRDGSRLTASRISSTVLSSSPLVVLSACGTAGGRVYRNEGIDSIAAAFLHGGARGVVATLWDVADTDGVRLSLALHRELRDGAGAAEAVRRVQRSMIRSRSAQERDPAAWAALVLMGKG